MKRFARLLLWIILLALPAARGLAAVAVESTVEPQEIHLGDEAQITYTLSGSSVEDFQLPGVDGLTVEENSSSSNIVMNNLQISQSVSHTFLIVANRAGNIIIPAFDIHDGNGQVVARTRALTLHVLGAASANTPPASTPAIPSPSGPVVMPPGMSSPDDQDNSNAATNAPANGGARVDVPIDPDGQQARVFDVITPQTTTAYVGQAVPLRIESFIRVDAQAQQDSLPTLIGSDFLMNNLSLRPTRDGVNVGNLMYIRETWQTAIAAPRAGDFPLQATRDTYWTKSAPPMPDDPFGPLFGRQPQLLHKDIQSNKLVMHILPLPDQGRPAGFTGAIGKFQVSGNATPATVGLGEPVTLHFTVTGQGNFDYVHAPVFASNPDWKIYAPTSQVNYQDEGHTQAMKIFDEALIPRKPGALSLPTATFSYFDPDLKQYVVVPVTLPTVTVTGTLPAPVAATTTPTGNDAGSSVAPATPGAVQAADFAPNRLGLGRPTTSLAPVYEHVWFWVLQALLLLLIAGATALGLAPPGAYAGRREREAQQLSLRRQDDAMSRAARDGDAVRFFTAARQVVQLQLAGRWGLPPGTLTIEAITQHDPALGEVVAPLFHEADDVIYSGANPADLDLQAWERRVRELLQPAKV